MICNSLTDVCFIYLDHHLEGRNAESIMKSKQHLFCLSLVLSLVCSTATNHQIMLCKLPIEQLHNLCRNSNNKDQIITAMVQASKNSVKALEHAKVIKLLKELRSKQIGTNEVEFSVNRTCKMLSTSAAQNVKMKIMSAKISDAFKESKRRRRESRIAWKEAKKIIPGELMKGYLDIWKKHMKKCEREVTKKHDQKVAWLVKRWRSVQETVPSTVRDIVVADDDLPEEFDSTPRIYGGVQLDEEEKAALTLSPKYGLYRPLRVEQAKIDVEEALNKLRWNAIIKEGKGDRQGGGHGGGTGGSQVGRGRFRQSGGESQLEDDSDPPEFVDRVSRQVDINNLRVTQLPYNPSVCMPRALDGEMELKLHQVKVEVRDAVRKMVSKSAKWGNVSDVERRGLEKLCRRVKAGEIVCFVTDKSGRMSCDSLQNYKRACQAELSDDSKTPEITMEDHDLAEKEMNAEGLALLRMLGLNDDTAGERLRNAIVAEGVRIPPFYGMRKDHKVVKPGEEEVGPRVRPVCGAEDCVTKRVSYILCMLLSHLIPEDGTHCWSTDDLLSEFEKVNRNQVVDGEWIVGSLDVNSLYPSLDIDRCARVVSEKLFHSDLKFGKLV